MIVEESHNKNSDYRKSSSSKRGILISYYNITSHALYKLIRLKLLNMNRKIIYNSIQLFKLSNIYNNFFITINRHENAVEININDLNICIGSIEKEFLYKNKNQ